MVSNKKMFFLVVTFMLLSGLAAYSGVILGSSLADKRNSKKDYNNTPNNV